MSHRMHINGRFTCPRLAGCPNCGLAGGHAAADLCPAVRQQTASKQERFDEQWKRQYGFGAHGRVPRTLL